MRFRSRRFLTRGVDSTIPVPLQLHMWGMIEHIPTPDYLQVFTLTGKNGEQHIILIADTVIIATGNVSTAIITSLSRYSTAMASYIWVWSWRLTAEVHLTPMQESFWTSPTQMKIICT
ncbi:MAG: DUF960 family protein [Huintestinicola sp.]